MPRAIKESQARWRAEQELHTQLVAIELDCAIGVLNVDGDLPNRGKSKVVVLAIDPFS